MARGDALSGEPEGVSAAAAAHVALLLAGAMVTLPFLLPEHRLPIRSFYDEWLAFALGSAALVAAAIGVRGRKTDMPEMSLWVAALALWLAVQAALRPPAYVQLPAAGIVFLLFAAAITWLGRWLRTTAGAERCVDSLATFLLAGATLNALIGIVQFYGVPAFLDGLVATPSGARSVGHVGQANVFAMYVAIGEASLVYLFARRRLPSAVACVCGAVLVLGSTYSQSRSALLFSGWLVAASWVLVSGDEAGRRVRVASVALAVTTVVAMLAVPLLHEALGIEGRYASALGRLVDAGVLGRENRPAAWSLAFDLLRESPWLGVGWGEFAGAAFERGMPDVMVAAYEVWSSPHNVVLQILAEGGMVAGAIALAGAGRWWWRSLRALRERGSSPDWWVIGVVGVVTLHAMVEYPLWYAHVLALAALGAGLAPARGFVFPAAAVRTALAVGIVALAALLPWSLVDYQRFERAFLIAKGDTLAGKSEVASAVETLASLHRGPLGPYAEPWLHRARAPEESGMPAMGERVLRRAPDSAMVARHAVALALAGHAAAALALTDHALATLPRARDSFERVLSESQHRAIDALAPLRARVEAARR